MYEYSYDTTILVLSDIVKEMSVFDFKGNVKNIFVKVQKFVSEDSKTIKHESLYYDAVLIPEVKERLDKLSGFPVICLEIIEFSNGKCRIFIKCRSNKPSGFTFTYKLNDDFVFNIETANQLTKVV